MSKLGCRSDFISDNSSSDDDSLPDMGSLRDRLARKRKIISMNMSGSSSPKITSPKITSPKITSPKISSSNARSPKTDVQISSIDCKDDNTNSAASFVQPNLYNFDDSSGDEIEFIPQNRNTTSSKCHGGEGVTLPISRPPAPKVNKRSAEEIENKRKEAQEKKDQREREKQTKEAEKEMRRVERESKKHFSLATCLKYIQVVIDTHVVNTCGLGAVILKACEELGVTCETKELVVPFTITWKRQVTECRMTADMKVQTVHGSNDEQDVVVVVPVNNFVQMIDTFKMKQRGQYSDGMTFREYVIQLQACLPDRTITLVVPGLEQYFRDLKSSNQRKYKQAVQGNTGTNNGKKGSKQKAGLVTVTRVDIEEAVTDTLLQTGCTTFMIEKSEDVADLIRRFSKAVAERPAKKDRFNPIFSFHEEGVGGVKVDKNGNGLLKVWKQQLLQFKNCSPDVSQSIITQFPSPRILWKAYQRCSSEKEAIKLLEDIVVRRGAGVLETTRRVGKELSRKIYMYFTSEDPDLVIK